jgi:uncharacterized membrane protein
MRLLARSVTSAATITTRTGTNDNDASSPTESTIDDYNYQTSRIVRIAVISGVIVLVITALVLFFKVSFSFFNLSIADETDHLMGSLPPKTKETECLESRFTK